MQFDIFTLFPEICAAYLQESILKRAQEAGLVEVIYVPDDLLALLPAAPPGRPAFSSAGSPAPLSTGKPWRNRWPRGPTGPPSRRTRAGELSRARVTRFAPSATAPPLRPKR